MHTHAEGPGALRHEFADMAEAHDAERLAVNLGVRLAGGEAARPNCSLLKSRTMST